MFVDITNYLTIDCNRPLHVFDADKINGNLEVFLTKGVESLKALDEKDYKLSKDMIGIKDNKNLLSIAGIIGGISSMCDLNTKNVFLEAAYFDPVTIAKAGRLLNIETDATKTLSHVLIPAPSKFFIAILNNIITYILVF